MGMLRDWMRSRDMEDPVDGTAHVVSASRLTVSATSSNCRMTLVVQADGFPATTVEHEAMAPASKWPDPGSTLPVTFDRADPSRLKVRFDDMPSTQELAEAQAQQLAQAMNSGGPGGFPVTGAEGVDDMVSALQQAFPGATIQVGETTVVQGPDAAAPPVQPAPAQPAAGDHVQQLERLAELHRQGVLSDAEFAQAKARVLGSG